MKLPNIAYTRQVGSGGMIDPYAPVAVGRARARAAENVSGAAASWEKFGYARQERQDKLDAAKATETDAKTMAEFDEGVTANPDIPIEDIPPEVLSKSGVVDYEEKLMPDGTRVKIPKKTVPVHEVYAELKKATMEGAKHISSRYIRNKNLRAAWVADTDIVIAKNYGMAKVAGEQMAINYTKDSQDASYNQSLQTSNFELAAEQARTMLYRTSDYKREMEINAYKSKEVHGYNKAQTMGIEQIKYVETLKRFVDPQNEKYTGDGGLLNSNERLAVFKKLDARLRTLNSAGNAERSAALSLLRDEAKSAIEHISNLRSFDVLAGKELAGKIAVEYPVMARDLYMAIELQPVIAEYGASGAVATGAGIRELEAKSHTASGVRAEEIKFLINA